MVEEGEGPSGTAQEKVSEMVNDLGCILKQTNKQKPKKIISIIIFILIPMKRPISSVSLGLPGVLVP